MDIESQPPWSGKKLAKLGDAIVAGVEPPEGCPAYSEVMEWHSDLCGEVASLVTEYGEAHFAVGFDITARAKTLDTLRDKLRREKGRHLKLNQVQDLAGVRVDIRGALGQQTAIAHGIAEYFGAARAEVKDIRDQPHSGYRAVHVWLRLPAGRVEVQVRTWGQSVWANTFERLGDFAGRHIRYGVVDGTPAIDSFVDQLLELSSRLLELERTEQAIQELRARHNRLDREIADRRRASSPWTSRVLFPILLALPLRAHKSNRTELAELEALSADAMKQFVDHLEAARRRIEQMERTAN